MANGGNPIQVLLIPGIGGTSLSNFNTAGKTPYWYNPDVLLSKGPGAMALAGDGQSPYPDLGVLLNPDGPVQLGIYEPLLAKLQTWGYTARFYSYDWRLDLGLSSGNLVKWLLNANMANNFTVIAHSMGGLIALLAYSLYAASHPSATWYQTVYVNVPQGGSLWASMMLNGLFGEGWMFNLVTGIWNLSSSITSLTLRRYNPLTRAVNKMFGSWPSMYQLFPSAMGPWASIDPLAGQALELSNYARGPGGVQQQWLDRASAVQDDLVAQLEQARAKEFSINGLNIRTPLRFVQGGDPTTFSGYTFGTSGDGTVDILRGTLPNIPAQWFNDASHNGMLTSFIMTSKLQTWLAATPSDTITFNNDPPPVLLSDEGVRIHRSTIEGPKIQWPYPDEFLNRTQDP
jgi:pimeloyl-ACP methyl ester carboxylesterase